MEYKKTLAYKIKVEKQHNHNQEFKRISVFSNKEAVLANLKHNNSDNLVTSGNVNLNNNNSNSKHRDWVDLDSHNNLDFRNKVALDLDNRINLDLEISNSEVVIQELVVAILKAVAMEVKKELLVNQLLLKSKLLMVNKLSKSRL